MTQTALGGSIWVGGITSHFPSEVMESRYS